MGLVIRGALYVLQMCFKIYLYGEEWLHTAQFAWCIYTQHTHLLDLHTAHSLVGFAHSTLTCCIYTQHTHLLYWLHTAHSIVVRLRLPKNAGLIFTDGCG